MAASREPVCKRGGYRIYGECYFHALKRVAQLKPEDAQLLFGVMIYFHALKRVAQLKLKDRLLM